VARAIGVRSVCDPCAPIRVLRFIEHADILGTVISGRRSLSSLEHTARDALLVARIASGDESALSTLVTLYGQPLRDFAYLTVRDLDLAADVIQEVFVSLWRRRETLSIQGTVADYLYRATRNRALTMLKHEGAHVRLRDRLGYQCIIDPAAADPADAPLATKEFADAIDAALASLTPRVREAFLLRQVHGMSYAQIAAVLEVTIPTAQSQVSRALRQISEHLKPFR
jgi:RNA polymerase sigma-70 factor (ECF subfamily)